MAEERRVKAAEIAEAILRKLVDVPGLLHLGVVKQQFLRRDGETDFNRGELRHERGQLGDRNTLFVDPALATPGIPSPHRETGRLRIALARRVPVPECSALIACFNIARAVADRRRDDGIEDAARFREHTAADIRLARNRPLRTYFTKPLRLRLGFARGILTLLRLQHAVQTVGLFLIQAELRIGSRLFDHPVVMYSAAPNAELGCCQVRFCLSGLRNGTLFLFPAE